MLTGHRPVMRRRTRRSRAARIAIPIAIPVALGLTLGIVIAVSSHSGPTKVNSSAFGATASASPSASASASASAAAAPATTVQALPVAGQTFAQADVAGFNAQDAAGNAINFNQTAAQAATSMNCTLAVPANALTAQGLATPWQLGDGCQEAQQGGTEGAFVEATILSPNGQLQVYDPLVITAGTRPAVNPTPPTIATGSQVIIDVGFNGNAIALTGFGATQANCIDALGNSLINQTPTCNARNFYNLANQEIAAGTLKVPAAGTSPKDGQACQTTTSFATIDQDQSDNVVGAYLVNATTGQTAQNTAANSANLQGFTKLGNGSDDGLLAAFVDPSLGCTPFTAPNTTSATGTSGSQALNVLSARQNQTGTTALVPVNDPQMLLGGKLSIQKTNVYRAQVDQPLLSNFTNPQQNAATYCQNMVNIQTPKLKLDAAIEANFGTPVPALGANLATALANRELQSFGNLNCQDFGLTNPITATLDGNGVLLSAVYNTNPQTAKVPGGTNTGGNAFPQPNRFGDPMAGPRHN